MPKPASMTLMQTHYFKRQGDKWKCLICEALVKNRATHERFHLDNDTPSGDIIAAALREAGKPKLV